MSTYSYVDTILIAASFQFKTGSPDAYPQNKENCVDVAVSDLTGGPSIGLHLPSLGKVNRVASIGELGPGDDVVLTGASSGTLNGIIKGCGVWQEFTFAGKTYCFSDLLVIEDSVHHYLASQFTKAGDSGAWVSSNRAGIVTWDAMLIGGDGASCAYCCYAENVMAAIDPSLVVPP